MVLRDPFMFFADQVSTVMANAMNELSEEGWRDLIVKGSGDTISVDSGEVSADITLEMPPEGMGDFAFPCFVLAKAEKRNPAEAARELAGKIEPGDGVTEVRAVGPYVNFFLDRTEVAADTLRRVHAEDFDYGKSRDGLGHIIVIDFSSPNIAKPFNIGHVRSTAIGHALYNIYEALGYECVGVEAVLAATGRGHGPVPG